MPHPSGFSDLCIVIDADGADEAVVHPPLPWREMDPSALRNRIRELGIVGLGGAVFPSFIKLNPGRAGAMDVLILNGAECEPWITCDDMLMRERADAILAGADIMRTMLHAGEVIVGIEDNKPEAIAAMRRATQGCGFRVEVVVVPTLYPTGGGKQLTRVVTGRVTPRGGLSTDVGVQVFNVGTAYALHRAVDHGEAMVSRIVTITGNVRRPRNLEARVGTSVADLLNAAAGAAEDTRDYVIGGPMMGIPLSSPGVPITKASNCVIATSDALFPAAPPPMPCIRCGRCAQTCPAELQPQELYWYAKSGNFGRAQEYDLFECIECGCCNYVCPSHIPLVQFYRYAKSEIWAREKEKRAADLARERHELRQSRIEREKQERAMKLAARTAAAKPSDDGMDEGTRAKKAAIAAALERARAQKAQVAPKNVDNLPTDKQREISEIEARRARAREAAAPTEKA